MLRRSRLVALLLLALAGAVILLRKYTAPLQQLKPKESGVSSRQLATPVLPSAKPLQPSKFTKENLSQSDVEHVRKFVLFTGYERSGHSFIGSVLDAHPNIILSTAFFLFRRLVPGGYHPSNVSQLYNDIYHKSLHFSQRADSHAQSKGYTLDLPGLWQGNFESLQVIGDKSAAKTTDLFTENSSLFYKGFQYLSKLIRVPILVIHVVRNPYDMISTDVLYRGNINSRGKVPNASAEHKYSNPALIRERAAVYFRRFEAVVEMTEQCRLALLEVHSEDLVQDFRGTLQRVCDVLGVECSEEYIERCQEKAYKSVSRTRDCVEWTPELRELVERNAVEKYSFLSGYTFEDNFLIKTL